jgi:hypothetical protein
MQKIITSTFALLLTASLFAQHEPIQPFEEMGIKVKVLTLSNGKYQESFPNDTTFRFGSVMFNRITGEVVTVIENDTLYGEYNLKAEVVSRWLSPDPLAAEFANQTPYNYAGNNPIMNIDVDGLFQFPAALAKEYAEKYPLFTKYLQENIKNDVMGSEALMNGLLKYSNGGLTREYIESDLTFGSGPTIVFKDLDQPGFTADGHYDQINGVHTLEINEKLIAEFEKAAANPKAIDDAKLALLLGGVSTVLHEYVHYGDRNNDYGGEGAGGVEEGHAFEGEVYNSPVSVRPFSQKFDIGPTLKVINLLRTGRYNPSDKTEPVQEDKINPSVLPTMPKN